MNHQTYKSLYEKGKTERSIYLEIARDNASTTIPYIYPREGLAAGGKLDKPFQSLGARGVNHLASQLLNVLFPTDKNYFKLTVDTNEEVPLELQKQVEDQLIDIEKMVRKEFDGRGLRNAIYNGLKALLVGGTIVISNLDDNFRVLRLPSFVIRRDAAGEVKYVIYRDEVSAEMASRIAPGVSATSNRKKFEMFTYQEKMEDGKYKVCQEVGGERVSEAIYNKPQILVITTNVMDGEHYGRSYVEELQGDLFTLEQLSKSVSQTAAIASKSIFMVNPAGHTRANDLARASNGSIISGRSDDVSVVQSQKGADLGVVYTHIAELKERLGRAFLLAADAFPEREITATEARARLQEIESALGGIYSMLSKTLQLPFLELLIQSMTEKGDMPTLPDSIKPVIITGMDLLDRKTKVGQVGQFLQFAAQFGEQGLQFIDVFSMLSDVARSIGLDPDDFLKDPQAQGMDPQAMMAQMVQQGAQGAAAGVAQGMAQQAQAMMSPEPSPEQQG